MILAIISGVCGAIASLFGKLAFSDNKIIIVFENIFEKIDNADGFISYSSTVCLRIIFFILMITFNGLMMNNFLKSMRNNSSVSVAVVSSASNYLTTGFIGYIILEEYISLYWFLGSILITIGLCLIFISQVGSHAN